LHKTDALSDDKQSLVKGKLYMMAKDVSKRINKSRRRIGAPGFEVDDEEEDVHLSYLDAVVPTAGDPHLTLEILSCSGLISETAGGKLPDPQCGVYWDSTVVGYTTAVSQSIDPVWSIGHTADSGDAPDGNGNFFRMALSRRAEMMSTCNLIIEVADASAIAGSGSFLGSVYMSFWSILRLSGKQMLPLCPLYTCVSMLN
jgi:hypothetical protein